VRVNDKKSCLGLGAVESARLLSAHGYRIELRFIHPTKADRMSERLRLKLKLALGTRKISALAELPVMKDD
jgi:hypothetical protein